MSAAPNSAVSLVERKRHAVHGWCSTVDLSSDEAPAVIVNPDASDAALVAWALGQVEQVNVVLAAVAAGSRSDVEDARLAASIQHFNEQAEAVLTYLSKRNFYGRVHPPP